MRSIEFQAAVDAARKALDGIETSPGKVRVEAADIVRMISDGADDNALAALVERSSADALCWDALAHVCAIEMRNGKPLPAPIAEWAARALTGQGQKPPRPKGHNRSRAGDYLVRDLHIYDAVMALAASGIQPGKNETTDSINAYEAVAEALRLMGSSITSPSAVKTICQKFNRQTQGAGLTRLVTGHIARKVQSTGV